jgi:tetratricopeptide (TPR) repeat protein
VGLFGGFNAEKKLDKAGAQLQQGAFYEARAIFEEILGRQEVDPAIREQAKNGWRKARRGLIDGQREEAELRLQAGERDEALECLRTIMEIAGDDIDVSEIRAKLERIDPTLTPSNPTERILSHLDDSVAQDELPPEEGEAVAGFGQSPDDLFEVYLNAVPEPVADLYRAQGEAFRDVYLTLQDGDIEGALEGFAKLPSEQAADPIVRLEWGQALLLDGKHEEALGMLLDLPLPDALEHRRRLMAAQLLEQVGRKEEAFEGAQSLYRDFPADTEAAALYAEILILRERAEEALKIVKNLIEAGDPSPDLVNLAARAYIAAGKVEEGRDLLEQSLENFFQGPGWRGQTPRFPLGAARELLGLYIALDEEPEIVRAMAQHLVTYDPDRADQYREALRRYAEERERKQSAE